MGVPTPKGKRFNEFLRRLAVLPPASNFQEGYEQLAATLNKVEDELSGIEYNPNLWRTDGRMYPPREDNIRDVPGRPHVKRLRSLGHNTFIGDNGSIEVQTAGRGATPGEVVFSKPGASGKGVWEL